jgi:methionyl aminopeptidase
LKYGRNDDCFCGSGQKYKKCHGKMAATPAFTPVMAKPKRDFQIMTPATLPRMRRACKLAANILEEVGKRIQPGINTLQIDEWVLDLTLAAGAYPSPLNYPKGHVADPRNPKITPGAFPRSVCTSVNHVVCHGVPSAKDVLKDGDIINVDVTVFLDGFHGDTSRTFYVGEPGPEARLVTEAARECLQLGIDAVKPHGRLIEIGRAIYAYASQRNLGVVRDYTGHGVGTVFHAEPQVCHYPSRETDCELVPGMTFTIEPMINAGTYRTFVDRQDKWTVYTIDGRLSAQFEHTVTVTQTGVEVLTLPD